MNQKTGNAKKSTFISLDSAASIQLFMITVVIIAYVIFLIFQRYLFSFEDLLSKLIIVNVLLAAGIVMEIIAISYGLCIRKRKS